MNNCMFRIYKPISLILCVLLSACANNEIKPGLNDTAQHTGTISLLRVDDAWHFDKSKRHTYHIGEGIAKSGSRFVPVRHEGEIAGLDTPDRIITKDDYISLTLKSGFIKYFREPGCKSIGSDGLLTAAIGERLCKGEIAIVLSFDDGKQVKENLLIYSAQGQTLGSPLALDDWPVVGPVKIEGDTLLVRLVVIELDKRENEQARQVVRFLTSTITALQPQAGPVLEITQKITDALINANQNDIIADTRFSLQRVGQGNIVTRNALLYGKYILIQQEDPLADSNIETVSPHSLNPLVLHELRYDLHSDRLYKIYPYDIEPCGDNSVGPIDWSKFAFGAACEGNDADLNRASAIQIRIDKLGFDKKSLGTYDTWASQDEAFYQALSESCRALSGSKVEDPTPDTGWIDDDYTHVLRKVCPKTFTNDDLFRFEYPAVLFPDANILLAGYPLHTHLIFSIDKSIPRTKRFDEQFADFNKFLEDEVKAAQSENKLAEIDKLIKEVRKEVTKQESLFKKVSQLGPSKPDTKLAYDKTCKLWSSGLMPVGTPPKEPEQGLAAPIYNEIFHITGKSFDQSNEITEFLTSEGKCTIDTTKRTCQCP